MALVTAQMLKHSTFSRLFDHRAGRPSAHAVAELGLDGPEGGLDVRPAVIAGVEVVGPQGKVVVHP